MELIVPIVVITVIAILLLIVDAFCYIISPYEIRSGHRWSYCPGSGYYALYLSLFSKKQ